MTDKTKKLANRHVLIRRQLLVDGVVNVESLAQTLNVSVATIRRDLSILEDEGSVRRTHGGATDPHLRGGDQEFAQREQIDSDAKRLIARAALELIEHDQTLFMNDGSTLLALARELVLSDLSLTVATSGVNIATALSENPEISTYLAGGLVRHKTRGTTGDFVEQMLSSINADVAFISAEGFSVEEGLTYSYEVDAKIARVMYTKAKSSVILATNRKIGQRDRITAVPASAIDVLITNNLDQSEIRTFQDLGIKVISETVPNSNKTNLNLISGQEL